MGSPAYLAKPVGLALRHAAMPQAKLKGPAHVVCAGTEEPQDSEACTPTLLSVLAFDDAGDFQIEKISTYSNFSGIAPQA